MPDKICKVEGCGEPIGKHGAKGFCPKHYWCWHKYGNPLEPSHRVKTYCKVEGCNKRCHGKGYCDNHYRLFVKRGEPITTVNKNKLFIENRAIYAIYNSMKQRCFNPNTRSYKNYGGRGITVCDRWLGKNGFRNFLKDMGERPEGKTKSGRALYSIDRIDNDGNYEPDNCRWATPHEQGLNTRRNRKNC